MKKQILSLFLLAATCSVNAQNLQLHYDFRGALDKNSLGDFGTPLNERNYLTATFEWLLADKLGETFMFVDFDFNGKGSNIGLTYAEISRKFNLGNLPVQALVEFNGGLGNGFSIPNSYLAGASYSTLLGSWFFNTYAAYKLNNFHRTSHDIQWTLVWSTSFFKERLTFTGYSDVWTENKNRETGKEGKKLIFMSEPQLWYNIVPQFAIGSEVELSCNFVKKAFKAYPTLGMKYTFK